jgi:hypothetical protein
MYRKKKNFEYLITCGSCWGGKGCPAGGYWWPFCNSITSCPSVRPWGSWVGE